VKIKKLHNVLRISRQRVVLSLFSLLLSFISFSQVTKEVDTTKIRIGEQINYKIKVEADSTALVVFPEGQTFSPLEAVEALEIDTTKKDSKFKLSRIYKLTHFDSGSYTIPRQKIIIGEKPFYTDSLRVDVGTVEVDTTKQKLYDIKPIIEVEKNSSNWWIWLLVILAALALIGFLLWWFVWREKPLTEEEEIALLPPYDRAKLALKKLDNSQYLIRSEVKEYYSELTMIIRKYLDEKVYERSLESTTDELMNRLQLLKEGNQFPFSKETLNNLETILKRADLVKFAKSAPDTALIEMDRATIEKEIESVKAILPEPSEEEKLLDQQYKEAQERKKKRTKILITVASLVLLLAATYVGFGLKYGFKYVHISTDHIYTSKKNIPNNEKSKIGWHNSYSKSKYLAEKNIKLNSKSLIIRTNFVDNSSNKKSFLYWLVDNFNKNKKISLFYDMFTSTIDLNTFSKILIKLILTKSSGVFNIGSNEILSKKEFAIKYFAKLKKKLKYKIVSVNNDNLIPLKRGKYLGLNVKKIEKKLKIKMPNSNKIIKNLIYENIRN